MTVKDTVVIFPDIHFPHHDEKAFSCALKVLEYVKPSAFLCWCFLNKENEEHFKISGEVNNWNCGNRVWLVDLLSLNDSRNMVKWTNRYFSKLLGVGKKVNYLRIDDNWNKYRVSSSVTKECYR